MPENMFMNVVAHKVGENKWDIMKHFLVKETSVHAREAAKYCQGEPLAWVYKLNTWGLKKAYQSLFDRVPGDSISHTKVVAKSAPAGSRGGSDEKGPTRWNPTAEEITAGIKFINDSAKTIGTKPTDALQWRLEMIHGDSPIHGWPMHYVKEAMEEIKKPEDQADANSFYPLLAWDLHWVLRHMVLPLVIAFCSFKGLLIVGMQKVGKTPFAIMVAMMLGRFQLTARGLVGRCASWRRGKFMDVFRKKPGEVQEGILLDDPTLDRITDDDLMSFGESDEATHCHARYNPTKWAKNQFRSLLTNVWSKGAEPNADGRTDITWEEFLAMLWTTIGHMTTTMRMALLGRYVTIVAGQNAIYVRPPSDKENGPILRFDIEDVHKDWLVEDHKTFLSAFKQQEKNIKYDTYEEALQWETDFVKMVMEEHGGSKPEEIVAWWLDHVANQRRRHAPTTMLAASASATNVAEVAYTEGGGYMVQACPPVQSGARCAERFHKQMPGNVASSSFRPAVKVEPIDDEGYARALQEQINMAGKLFTIEESPSPPKRSRSAAGIASISCGHGPPAAFQHLRL